MHLLRIILLYRRDYWGNLIELVTEGIHCGKGFSVLAKINLVCLHFK